MGYRVIFPKLLIRELKKESTSPIYLELEPTEPTRGEVVAVPPPRFLPRQMTVGVMGGGVPEVDYQHSPSVAVGDVVYFFPRMAKPMTIDGEKLLLIEEDDILLIENNA